MVYRVVDALRRWQAVRRRYVALRMDLKKVGEVSLVWDANPGRDVRCR
jgi:hypothetical protein